MKVLLKKVMVLVIAMSFFVGFSGDILWEVPVYAAQSAKKKQSGIRLKKNIVKDFGKEFGTINKANGGKLEGEFLYHGEFAVYMNKLKINYIFTDYDENAEYALTDDVIMNKLDGEMRNMVTGFKKKSSVANFVKSFKKNLYEVTADTLDGQPTSYYVGERYAEISFKLKKNSKRKYYLRVALDEKDNILPESLAWLTYEG